MIKILEHELQTCPLRLSLRAVITSASISSPVLTFSFFSDPTLGVVRPGRGDGGAGLEPRRKRKLSGDAQGGDGSAAEPPWHPGVPAEITGVQMMENILIYCNMIILDSCGQGIFFGSFGWLAHVNTISIHIFF